ncbi:hypothetical protein RRG08_048214 [Elysia crispata]|uniref:Uncharacterized protein n=1 Tax=Elysia crispata TaxID=231223 RepID=A0AAE0XZM1_9GAST|nr:hypothetical protein RRG08_048214 [Elysia crispata]
MQPNLNNQLQPTTLPSLAYRYQQLLSQPSTRGSTSNHRRLDRATQDLVKVRDLTLAFTAPATSLTGQD